MKPLISDAERIQAVRNFIVARYQKHVRIRSYAALRPYLNEKRINILSGLKMSGQEEIKDNRYSFIGLGFKSFFTENDAEEYFEWLVAVVDGTETATEDVVKQANDQLFRFIHIMNADIEQDKNVQLIAPYDWQQLFISFDERLTNMQKIIDKGEKGIVETLSKIALWLKKYAPLLDALEKENEKVFGKGKNNERHR